jgi:hypothetical protein
VLSIVLLNAALLLLHGCSAGVTPFEAQAAASGSAGGPRTLVLETDPMQLDRIYTSMEGPYDRVPLETASLDWVTAFRTGVVEANSGGPVGDEFFCHSQLQLPNTTRLLVTATGSENIVFPAGFAMPLTQILSGLHPLERKVTLLGMALNNHREEIDETVRVRWEIDYWEQGDPERPADLKTLYKVGLPMTVENLEAYHPPQGVQANEDVATHCVLVEGQRTHWVVPPGSQRTRKRLSAIVPVPARVHFAAVHLHNHAVYMRLTDLESGEVLWQTDVVYEPDRRQIEEIPVYSSAEGFPIRPDREYEIEAYYENTAGKDVDAMAQMDLYYHPVGGELITYPEGPVEGRPVHH